ncbi:MAG: hypothetical protein WAQ08_08925 [Aquabacterium sp.]|jgi:hypothetical protein|uniref:hypothetical protein n=1 Tax=Aquabacterium sp. TaxID=1872578 RepID=UPI003BAE724B
MNKTAVVCAIACALISSLARAETTWSWSFAPDVLTISDASTTSLSINVLVKNAPTSTDSVNLGSFVLSDGSLPNFGVLLDAQSRPVLTLTARPPQVSSLAPGEQATITVATATISSVATIQDAIANGATYLLAPNYYVNVGGNWSSRMASQPLQIVFAPVPEPSSSLLFAAGALPLLAARYIRRGQQRRASPT